MTNSNPLSQYFRQPELYITLPSQGKFWKEHSLNLPPNNEIGIRSMNGADDLAMRNADGLMNGDTTVRVIESCCPNIKDAWECPSIDMDTIIIAIRIASYGHQLDMSTRCDKCNEFFDYAIDLRAVLQDIKIPNYDDPIIVDRLSIFIKPAPYKITNLNNQEIYQQQKTVIALKDANLTEDDKTKIITDALKKLTEITVNRLHEFIDYIIIDDGTKIDNREFIKEFVANADRDTFNIINKATQEKSSEYKLPDVTTACTSCGHDNTRALIFEPSTFFA